MVKSAPELARPALAVGLAAVLWGGYGVGRSCGWKPARLVLLLGLVVYHAYCAIQYQRFAGGGNTCSHVWFRWFNEFPVLMPSTIVALAAGKSY